MSNHFQGTLENPYHLSIGAVLRNDKGEIACHYFRHFDARSFGTFDDFYILMRETIEENETIEACLARGLQEEFGAVATLRANLGPIVCSFPKKDIFIEKTTLYFLCDLVSIDESLRATDDPEAESEIKWMLPEQLIPIMKEQGKRLGREDLDESKIMERVSKHS